MKKNQLLLKEAKCLSITNPEGQNILSDDASTVKFNQPAGVMKKY